MPPINKIFAALKRPRLMETITEPREPIPETGELTLEDIRLWAYDEDLILMEQDEDLLLYDFEYVPLLLELAADENCPKREDIFTILCQFCRERFLFEQIESSLSLEQCLKLVSDAQGGYVARWASYVRCLLRYRKGPFSVDKRAALKMGENLLLGPGRIGKVRLTKRAIPEWWELLLVTSIQEYLYINKKTGLFRYDRPDPMTDAALRLPAQ